jgi:hypothetical protein
MSGSSTTTGTSESKTEPWGPQKQGLKTAFTGALDGYKDANSAVAPDQFIAGMTPEQTDVFRQMLGYANGSAGNAAAAGNAGVGMIGMGANGLQGSLSGLEGFDPTKLNNTNSIIESATKYANNPAVDGMINAAMRDSRQQVRDVQLPGIGANAAVTGNTNSSRTGIAEGLVERGLAQQTADTSANIRGSMFDKGLELAQSGADSNNASTLAALNARGALSGSAYSSGADGVSKSINDQGNLFAMANMGGAGLQQGKQLTLDNLLAQYQSKVSSPFDAEKGLMSIFGTNNWGGTTTGTTTSSTTPSAWQVAGGILGGIGSLASGAGSMGFKPF